MRKLDRSTRRGRSLTRFLLAILLFQAYIPVGFMPAGGTPFLLELCPAAAPMPMSMAGHPHHHPGGGHALFQSCPFGSAPAAGPVAHFVAFQAPAPGAFRGFPVLQFRPAVVRFERAHPPRGPPSLV